MRPDSTNSAGEPKFELPVDLQELEMQLREVRPVAPMSDGLNESGDLLEFAPGATLRPSKLVTAVCVAWTMGAMVGAIAMFLMLPSARDDSLAEREQSSVGSQAESSSVVLAQESEETQASEILVGEAGVQPVSWLATWLQPQSQPASRSRVLQVRSYDSADQLLESEPSVPVEVSADSKLNPIPRVNEIGEQELRSRREIMDELMRNML